MLYIKLNNTSKIRHPTGGSFIRPNLVEFGIDIWKAVVSKYFENDVSLDENDKYLYNNFT